MTASLGSWRGKSSALLFLDVWKQSVVCNDCNTLPCTAGHFYHVCKHCSLYHTQSLHTPRHTVTTTVLRDILQMYPETNATWPLAPWSWVLLDKLLVLHMVNIFAIFCGTQIFISIPWSLSWTILIRLTLSRPFCLKRGRVSILDRIRKFFFRATCFNLYYSVRKIHFLEGLLFVCSALNSVDQKDSGIFSMLLI